MEKLEITHSLSLFNSQMPVFASFRILSPLFAKKKKKKKKKHFSLSRPTEPNSIENH